MTTQMYTHPDCGHHDTGPQHVEQIARLGAVLDGLAGDDFAGLDRIEAPRADPATLTLAHPEPFVDGIFALIPDSGTRHVDPDTLVSPRSGEAALRAAGSR